MTLLCRTAALLALAACAVWGEAAELNASVEVNADKIKSTSPETFQSLRQEIADYLNTTAFTTARYSPIEKIDCKFFLTVDEYTDNNVSGTLQVQSTRPVYGSSYSTPVLNIRDKEIKFAYSPGDRIVHSEASLDSELAALLDFYAYLILGLDGDTFAPKGGDVAYASAANIVNMARSTGAKGWRAIDDPRNRASILAALTSGPAASVRQMLYDYHRKGLDIMSVSPDKGRAAITETLAGLKDIADAAPMSIVLPLWRDAKLDEIINIYSKSNPDERKQVYELLSAVYPTDISRLEEIKKEPESRD